MILHLGKLVYVPTKKIVGIFNYEINKKNSNEIYNLVNSSQKIVNVDPESKIKCYIVTDDEIFLSPIAPNTLKKRLNININI
jgi:regulator of extracellular matrix RemA (YlzA/DUF370 family)